MHQVDLLSTFLCDSYIAKTYQLFCNTGDDKLYSIVNGFDKYVQINRNSVQLFSHFFFINVIKILIKTYLIINWTE